MKGRLLVIVVTLLLSACNGSPNVNPRFAPLVGTASRTPGPLMFVGMDVNGQPGIGEFRRSSNGNVKPLQTLIHADALVSLFGVDSSNNFWALFRSGYSNDDPTFYAVHFSASFAVLGMVNVGGMSWTTVDAKGRLYTTVYGDNIVEYGAGSYGKRVIRTISVCCSFAGHLLAVDGAGNLYASAYPADGFSDDMVAVWGRTASGAAPPKRTFSTGDSNSPTQMQVDSKGNLYFAFGNANGIANGIWYYAKSNPTPQWLLPGLPLRAFARDSAGNIYAEVPTIENNFAIEVFSPGGQMIADIAGAKTRLGFPSAIAVAP